MTVKFGPEYFQDEVREGFYIPGMIKRSWACQLDVLDKVRQICDKHGIKWFADYGTLIGAARHNGFIPWDDDLDICMLRDDLTKFFKYAKDELPRGYSVLDVFSNVEYNNFLVRVTNSEFINYTKKFLTENNDFPYAIGIDIFPLDYIYNDEAQEEQHRLRAAELIDFAEKVKDRSDLDATIVLAQAEEIAGFNLEHDIPVDAAIIRAIHKIFMEAPKEGAENVACYYFWAKNHKQKYPLSFFEKEAILSFEGDTINVPPAYAEKLRLCYGSWEKVNRNGGIHGYPYFADQEQTLKEALNGTLPYIYEYDKKDLQVTRHEKIIREDKNKELFFVLKRVLLLAGNAIDTGDIASMLSLAEQGQKLAINLGESIEKRHGEGTKAVEFLEAFCENIYIACDNMAGNMIAEAAASIEEAAKDISGCEADYNKLAYRKLAVFMPFDSKYWKQMEAFYEEMVSEPEWDVWVMPISCFDKDFFGNLVGEHYAPEDYPAKLNAINFKEFDFADFFADMIVIQNPYDDRNSAISVTPFFYASILRKYTDELVYIPYFHVDDILEGDFKAKSNLKWYAMTKGVMYADNVLLDSENIRTNYIDFLVEKVGDYSRDIWEEKIICKNNGEMSANGAKTRIKNKKTLLFCTGFSEIYVHKEKMLDKIKRVIDTFAENSEKLEIEWKTDSFMRENLEKICPELVDDYYKLVDEYLARNLGSYSEDGDIKSAIDKADAFYGTGGIYMNYCVLKHVPVMILNIEV